MFGNHKLLHVLTYECNHNVSSLRHLIFIALTSCDKFGRFKSLSFEVRTLSFNSQVCYDTIAEADSTQTVAERFITSSAI